MSHYDVIVGEAVVGNGLISGDPKPGSATGIWRRASRWLSELSRAPRVSASSAVSAAAAEASVPGMMGTWGFETTLDHSLELLTGVHIGITLFAVASPAPMDASRDAAVVSALSPLGGVGRLPDGRIGLSYLGPGGGDVTGALIRFVTDRVTAELLQRGWASHAELIEVSAVHGWTDRLKSGRALIEALPGSP